MRASVRAAALLALLALLPPRASGHGQLTWPPSTRHGGNAREGADCGDHGACLWFSNNVHIPGAPTLPSALRSVEPDVDGGRRDVWSLNPWRAPGTAPVYGSGCGVAGGHPSESYANGGVAPDAHALGFDGAALPPAPSALGPARWPRGGTAEVAFAMSANHGGGYAYRLCKKDPALPLGGLTEACFAATPLAFSNATAASSSFALYPDGARVAVPRAAGIIAAAPSDDDDENENARRPYMWARVPIPACRECAFAYDACGAPLLPTPGLEYGSPWHAQTRCFERCAGSVASASPAEGGAGACPGETHFDVPEAMRAGKLTGFGKAIWEWSVLDVVDVPGDLEPGAYALSWRWDCEESAQVWQNCADVEVTAEEDDEAWREATPEAMRRVPVAEGFLRRRECADLRARCAAEGEGEGAGGECEESAALAACDGNRSGTARGVGAGVLGRAVFGVAAAVFAASGVW